MSRTDGFEAERSRLVALAARMLGDHAEAEDVAQQAWLRLDRNASQIDNLGGWLTTVTTRLCLDRLKARVPTPVDALTETLEAPGAGSGSWTTENADPADHVALADTVGAALHIVLDRLSPAERVAFVLHDSFGFDFTTIAAMLDSTPAAARKLASRARAKIAQPSPEDALADWEVVDAFMAAARKGDFARLLALLAPDAVVRADEAALLAGTPAQLDGADEIAAFFNGSAHAALPVYVGERAGSAWFHRGEAKVVFDFTIAGSVVRRITFRAAPETLRTVARRDGAERR